MPGRSRQTRALRFFPGPGGISQGCRVQHQGSKEESGISALLPHSHGTERGGHFVCLTRQRDPVLWSPQQPRPSVPLFHGEVSQGGDNKGFPGHFLVCADEKRRNDSRCVIIPGDGLRQRSVFAWPFWHHLQVQVTNGLQQASLLWAVCGSEGMFPQPPLGGGVGPEPPRSSCCHGEGRQRAGCAGPRFIPHSLPQLPPSLNGSLCRIP